MYHTPVLLNQCIEGLDIKPGGIYVDATFGGGGHARAILEKLDSGRLIAFDQDTDANANIPSDERMLLINQNFRFMINFLRLHHAVPVDGILADLGISSHQIDVAERGFSSRFEGNLDMRMNRGQGLSASDIVNTWSFDQLARMFRRYGELKNAGQIAKALVSARETSEIKTTTDLANAVQHCFQANKRHKGLAMVFQALRITVNDELKALEEFLGQTVTALKPGGRLVVIAYHSLEDRLVKNMIKTGNTEGKLEKDFYGNSLTSFKPLTNKPVVPDENEVAENNRARSAKLRIAEKI